jgi:hypothetical protein
VKRSIQMVLFFVAMFLGQRASEAGQEQEEEEFQYRTSGIIYVLEYEIEFRRLVAGPLVRYLDDGILFKSCGKEKLTPDGQTTSFNYQLISVIPFIEGDPFKGARKINVNDNARCFAIRADEFDAYIASGQIKKKYRTIISNPLKKLFWNSIELAAGINLSIPFKMRPSKGGHNMKVQTDVNLGGYIGPKGRISATRPYYISLVVSGGLALLPLNDDSKILNEPSGDPMVPSEDGAETTGDSTVVGLTASGGMILELADFNVGFLFGKDWASGDAAEKWVYDGEWWLSFSVGYSFFGK